LHRVALRCGWEETKTFMREVGKWRGAVREAYDKVFS